MTDSIWQVALEVAAVTGLAAAFWLLRSVMLRRVRQWTGHNGAPLPAHLIDLLDLALRSLLIVGTVEAAFNLFPMPEKFVHVANRVVWLLILALGLFFCARAFRFMLNRWLDRRIERESAREPIRFVGQVLFSVLGVLILLENLGISLTAVWTTLGVGSIAVALALQDTLSNFFSGVYIHIDSPVHVGDYIKLDSGEEGFVLHLGWRSARVRTLSNNVVVVPNAKLASAILTNFSLPESEMSLTMTVNVSYESDPEQVERVLVEEARRAAGSVEGLLAQPAPFVRFIPGFNDSYMSFTLICRVASFVDQYLVQHELRKRIVARFRKEGIRIPYPQRDVHVYSHEQQHDRESVAEFVARAS